MDNSEEDAGNATIDSRRLEPREKELRTAAEALATVVSIRDAGFAPPVGDEVSDIDSMPSPGVPDANTSTEDILDMIDEFVDGPIAARRILCSTSKTEPSCESATSSSKQGTDSTGLVDVKTYCDAIHKSDQPAASVALLEQHTQCIPNPSANGDSTTKTSLQVTFPEGETCKNSLPNVCASSILPAETTTLSELPSSSANLTVACTVSSENNVRTVKSVSSSDLSEQIISDSVESSSNDSSVSLNKLEVSTHSPLKRRLVRPAPSDRPPDCTVSSTVDSHTVNVDTSELKSGECVTKDVSSSSDAVPVNVKPEEIRHISEVSLCQAETSVSPPKKIKLVRPKPPLNNPSELNIKSISSPDNERCQSTSSEKLSLPSSKSNIPGCSSTDLSDNSLINECKDITISADKQPINDAQKVSELEIVPSSLSTQTEQLLDQSVTSVEKPPTCNPNQIEINTPLNIQPSVSNSESTIPESQEKNVTLCPIETVISTQSSEEPVELNAANIQDTSDPEVEKRVPPLKLCVQRSLSSTDAESPSENEIHKRVPPLKLTVTSKELPKINEGTDEDERKVPPIILCKSYDSPIRGLVDDVKSIDTEKKVPPLRINTQTSEVLPNSMTNIPQAERKVPPLRISTTTGDITTMIATDVDHDKKVPPIKISAQPETIVQIDTLKLNTQSPESSLNDTSKSKTICDKHEDLEKKVPPIKLVLAPSSTFETTSDCKSVNQESQSTTASDTQISNTDSKQVPKLTIKIGSQKSEEMKSSVPKLTIKPIKRPSEDETRVDSPIPSITKLNIKPIPKPAEKIYDAHRKSSSSEISESEYSENDEGTSTSDQASASEQCPLKEVPKVTIKLGKICNQIEPTVPKLTIKGIQNCENDIQDSSSNLKLVVTQTDEELSDKVPKLTIKNIAKTDQPLSPKLTIKPIKPPPEISPADSLATTEKENAHIPKITIKPVLKNAPDSPIKTKQSTETVNSDSIPPVTKLNIKPVIKPQHLTETEVIDVKVPVISKLNIKPVLRPNTEDEEESDVESIPKISKINIKPLKAPEDVSSMQDDSFDVNSSCSSEKSIPTVTKLNIKPIIKPDDDDKIDSENQSSETGNSSDDNADVPVVTKLNIKPIIKPSAVESTNFKEETLPVVSKLNIKPILEPTQTAPLSPRILTKLNIKPIVNPNEVEQNTQSNDNDQDVKNPRLLVKINKRIISESNEKCNNIEHKVDHDLSNNVDIIPDPCKNTTVNCVQSSATQNSVKHDTDIPISNIENHDESKCLETTTDVTISTVNEDKSQKQNSVQSSDECVESVKEINKFVNSKKLASIAEALSKHENTKANVQNCKLLKQLLEQDSTCDKYSEDNKRFDSKEIKPDLQISVTIEEDTNSGDGSKSPSIVMGENKILLDKGINTNQNIAAKTKLISSQDISKDVTKPLEINTERVASPCSGQDSPRIILKINKTDHGSSAKIITEETLETSKNVLQEDVSEKVNETPPLKKTSSTRRKQSLEATPNETLGKRLRSSKVVHNAEQSPVAKRNLNKRQSTETVASQNKQTDMTVLEAKRLRLGQILSNKSLTVTKVSPTSPPNKSIKQDVKNINHTLLNNENCSKNGNSQLHNIFSNLQAKQIQMPLNDINTTKKSPIFTEARKDDPLVSIANSEEVSHTKNSLKDTVIMMNDFSEIRDFSSVSEERPQDPLEVENKITPDASKNIPEKVMETPTPRKRGRPRKLPVSEDAKTVGLPTPALEERPQRSLRLSRERPAILAKPRGRGRGRGAKRATTPPAVTEPIVEKANKFFNQTPEELDPTSSRVKLPRMTEALDKMPSVCSTPLSSRRHSDSMDRLSPGSPDLKSMMDSLPKTNDSLMRSPEGVVEKVRARRGPGSRGGKVRTPKGRGRGRGGGKGAMYMRETMGIYGRVCGPATTTVELFEEETQMMEDSATPSKPSHLLDEDSQSSVMSSTNDSSKPRKSKFADLFDSNKVWTASDVKEYTWPPPDTADGESQVMMIQEQVAMFLSVKSFKRRYPELKRRTIVGEEKEYVLSKGLVTEALCDLGITAVEASEVLDIMLSDYPHKYEEYRTYQRDKQIADQAAEENEPKPEVRDRIEMKIEKLPEKQEPKVDPEKTRQDMAAAAIASASEFNSRMNALRRPAVVDLQSLVIHRRRPPVVNPQIKLQPPGGFYPHALLPGQYQHGYKVYTSEQLRYFPLNTVLAAPPAAASPPPSSASDDDSSGASDDDAPPKRKKLTKTKRTSDDTKKEDDPEEKVDLCRVCNLRVEANRKYTHERFLVCSSCDAKLHPSCIELNADTIRKCREYAWQCVECKCCATCSKKQDDDKMLFCDLCDRGFHIYCVGLADVPTGRWHCVECAVCKSCGAREPSGPPAANPGPSGSTDLQGFSGTPSTPGTSGVAEWHHQTKRGPGGHKVYSHSLCTPCARAYRIGRYCPLCDRSFVGPKGTMQLIICKLCDRQHHKDCVKQTVSSINVLDYTCGECRRSGITSRSAAVRNAPRTIATLFMAKRRFNKYAHRQYMQSRMKKETDADPIDFEDECSEDITEVSDPLEVTAPDSESMPMDYGD